MSQLRDAAIQNEPKEVEDAILSVNDPSDLREAALRAMADAGIVARDEFDIRLLSHQDAPSLPVGGEYRCERTIRFDPRTGKRALVIRGNSEADLNALEAQILGY